jgi:hypothetical protein
VVGRLVRESVFPTLFALIILTFVDLKSTPQTLQDDIGIKWVIKVLQI